MRYRTQSVRTLLRTHPWTEEVLAHHGIDVDRIDPSMSLDALCWLYALDVHAVVGDLQMAEVDHDWAYAS